MNEILVNLCIDALNTKWDKDSNDSFMSWCGFCTQCNLLCNGCLCPKEICSNTGKSGYIAELYDIYDGNVLIRDMDDEHLEHMRNLFKYAIIKELAKVALDKWENLKDTYKCPFCKYRLSTTKHSCKGCLIDTVLCNGNEINIYAILDNIHYNDIKESKAYKYGITALKSMVKNGYIEEELRKKIKLFLEIKQHEIEEEEETR